MGWYDASGCQSIFAHQGAHGHAGAASDDAVRRRDGVLRAGANGAGGQEFRAKPRPDFPHAEDPVGAVVFAETRCGAGFVRQIGGALQLCLSKTDRSQCSPRSLVARSGDQHFEVSARDLGHAAGSTRQAKSGGGGQGAGCPGAQRKNGSEHLASGVDQAHPKWRETFSLVIRSNSSIEIPRNSATTRAVCITSAGSFTFCLRTGSGERYGESVSTRIRSLGANFTTSRSASVFL